MTQKTPRSRTNNSNEERDSNQPSSGPTFNIQGGIHANRDVIMGDQHNTINQNQSTTNINTPSQFMEELKKIKEEIERLKSLPNVDPAAVRRMDLVQADIDDVVDEAKKEAPTAERIKTTLDGAKEVMDKIGGSVVSAINLGTTLANLAGIAMKLFGG